MVKVHGSVDPEEWPTDNLDGGRVGEWSYEKQ